MFTNSLKCSPTQCSSFECSQVGSNIHFSYCVSPLSISNTLTGAIVEAAAFKKFVDKLKQLLLVASRHFGQVYILYTGVFAPWAYEARIRECVKALIIFGQKISLYYSLTHRWNQSFEFYSFVSTNFRLTSFRLPGISRLWTLSPKATWAKKCETRHV